MAGYNGCRMSNNAVEAYRNGEMPISKWNKQIIMDGIKEGLAGGRLSLQCSMEALEKLPEKALKECCLACSSWHHTGMYYRKTKFYSLDAGRIGELTDKELAETASKHRQEQENKQGQGLREEKWKCSYLEWSGGRRNRKAKRVVRTGTVKGQWFLSLMGKGRRPLAQGLSSLRK